jgi:hypothetical protein
MVKSAQSFRKKLLKTTKMHLLSAKVHFRSGMQRRERPARFVFCTGLGSALQALLLPPSFCFLGSM